MLKVLVVRVYLGESRMDVFVESDGEYLQIPIRWMRKEASDEPPERWLFLVEKELEERKVNLRRSRALKNFLSNRKIK